MVKLILRASLYNTVKSPKATRVKLEKISVQVLAVEAVGGTGASEVSSRGRSGSG